MDISLDLTSLRSAYANGLSPVDLINEIYDRIERDGLAPIWISLVEREVALQHAKKLEMSGANDLPLYGTPFAVKDNIDTANLLTTAGCPAFSYNPAFSATAVEKLEAAGAILIGKTNLDQFATGLVGVRSPYGICSSVFSDEYISGGSSSGSAVAVAKGLVSFSLGTDTAGSGRVPAAFNNIVGLKPTRGVISAAGVVPACRSLDCVSIFSLTASDGSDVFEAALGGDQRDPWSRMFDADNGAAPWLNSDFRFGVPYKSQLEFFGDNEAQSLFDEAVEHLSSLGGIKLEFDLQPFLDTAALLYSGPFVAERLASIKDFYSEHSDEMEPTVRGIIGSATKINAVDTFNGMYKLKALQAETSKVWESIDILLLPTTGTTYRIADVLAEPLLLNTNLGYYTNFVNLLDLAAIAVPAGFRTNGLPFGVTLIGQSFTDRALTKIGDRLHRCFQIPMGGTNFALNSTPPAQRLITPPGCTLLAVVGAHLTGQPLNHQLTSRGAKLEFTSKSAPNYRLYALPNTSPEKPGLVRDIEFSGSGIELEVWAMPTKNLGSFVAEVPAPLGIGTVEIENGGLVKGFICEPSALTGAFEITDFGGWRNYRLSKSGQQ